MSDPTNALREAIEKLNHGLETMALREIGMALSEARYGQSLIDAAKIVDGNLPRAAAVMQVVAAVFVRNTAAQVSLLISDPAVREETQQESIRVLTKMLEQGMEEGLRVRTEALAAANKHAGDQKAWAAAMEKLMEGSTCSALAVPEDFAEARH